MPLSKQIKKRTASGLFDRYNYFVSFDVPYLSLKITFFVFYQQYDRDLITAQIPYELIIV
jgi:hypothetical protein